MPIKKKLMAIISIVGFAATLLVFQNCSNAKFAQVVSASTAGQSMASDSEDSLETTGDTNSDSPKDDTTLCPLNVGAPSNPDSTAYAPDPLAPKGFFKDVSGLRGQQWVDSNEMFISCLTAPKEIILVSKDGNVAYTLNGVRTLLSFDYTSQQFFKSSFTVKNGDRLRLHQINTVWGNTIGFVTIYLNGLKSNWKNVSYNYAAFGGKNCTGVHGRCTGNVIGSMPVREASGYGPGGCVDTMQASQQIKCIEQPYSETGNCTFYDGPAVGTAADWLPGMKSFGCRETQ